MAMVEINDENFETEVMQSDIPVLVDFSASWCAPCKQLEPVINELADEYQGKVKVCHLDVEQARNTAIRYSVSSVPTLIFFKEGNQVDALIGFQPKPKLAEKFESVSQ